jgi:bacillithiol system protein YtxJ
MALSWIPLTDEAQIEQVILRSSQLPCLIFKHSTRCNISAIAQMRLEDDWPFAPDEMEAYYLDLIQFRGISNRIAEKFEVFHESPQVLLIQDGACTYDASHLDISVGELQEALAV